MGNVFSYFDQKRSKCDAIHDGLVDKLVLKLSGRDSDLYPFFEYPKGIYVVEKYFSDFVPVTRINNSLGNEIAINGEIDLVEFYTRNDELCVVSYEIKSTENGNGRYPKSKVIKRARRQLKRFDKFMNNVKVESRFVYSHQSKLFVSRFSSLEGSNGIQTVSRYDLG
ncbi:MAG: hypothetical protein ISS01_01250 [Nanoarchaeota archaeon]|nr:hypothetical protein [Nanoarchaeota archaeon]